MITELERRLHTLAQMAATLEAGDRAAWIRRAELDSPKSYADRAIKLFDAVDTKLAEPVR